MGDFATFKALLFQRLRDKLTADQLEGRAIESILTCKPYNLEEGSGIQYSINHNDQGIRNTVKTELITIASECGFMVTSTVNEIH